MSGGVDSSVAALLLKQQGYPIVGAYMKNWINEDNIIGHCPWMEDIEDARCVAEQIGIEFRVVNLMQEYRERVVQYLLSGYQRGLTPNPDIMCNREIKFGVFRAWARDNGFAAVATGHYAQTRAVGPGEANLAQREGQPMEKRSGRTVGETDKSVRLSEDPSGGTLSSSNLKPDGHDETSLVGLFEGADGNKDQSYFLALLNQDQLCDARFPIGHLLKPELRAIAEANGLVTAHKKDSQGICFIGEVKMQDFLRQYVPDVPGPIVRAQDERLLGEHRGLHYYTIGQRRGIGVPSNTDFQKYVVVGKRAADNALLVSFDAADAPGLFVSEIRVLGVSWNGNPVRATRALEGRVRYRDPRVKLTFIPEGETEALIRFDEPQRALASGQILALHDGARLIGGAVYV